ncbi:hypothetical protein OSTOST_04174 [Ostertagia ostertagi]
MAAVNDVVLPSFTNIGEPTSASSDESANVSVIYSSIPPDINMDSMSRATKSSAGGEMLRVSKRPDGKLSIFACDTAQRNSSSVYDRGHSSVCVVCHRTIADREMFLNFPDDLDRRTVVGKHAGLQVFCKVFNFNKAAIETLGMPTVASPNVRLTPSKKWIFAVTVIHSFCDIFRRIFEIARNNCRSSLLDPAVKWSSWTDRNVYLAYHGCEPPPRTPRKRPDSRLSTQQESSEHSNTSSPGVLHNSPSTNNAALPSQSTPCSTATTPSTTPSSVKSQTPRITPANSASLFITPPGNSSQSLTTQPHCVTRKTPHQNPRRPLIFPSPVKRDSAGVIKPSKTMLRPVLQLRKPLLPDDIAQKRSSDVSTDIQSQNAEQKSTNDEKCRSVAKIILKATSTPHHTLLDALNLMSAEEEDESVIADPALTKPLFSSSDVPQEFTNVPAPLLPVPRPSKTRRQLESVEARLRIFGDCSRVEVPSGYTAVETHSGVRLIEGGANIHDVSSVICLPRGRFVPVSRQ